MLYTIIMIRANMAYAAAPLLQFLTNPSLEHFIAIDQTIRYLFKTQFLAIVYKGKQKNVNLIIALDASFADNIKTKRLAQGYVIMLFGGAIILKAVRQAIMITLLTKAKLLALKHIAKEVIAL